MSWRGKYIGWYRIAQQVLGKLVPDLTSQEVMQNVTSGDQLIMHTDQESLPRNKAKPLPQISLELSDTGIELGILYHEQLQLDLFKNLFKETHSKEMKRLLELLQSLSPFYETVLYSKNRNEEIRLKQKYLSSRLDKRLLERIIDECDSLRKGGRRIENNESIYIPPRTPQLFLIRIKIPLNEQDYRDALLTIKPIYALLVEIKTQREIISEKLNKPRLKKNLYREFVETLNEVRRRDLISAKRRRAINKQWREREEEREELMELLKGMLDMDTGQENVS
ncbi:hypothetical protein GF326_03010 [Candidatus Bathyarchaeota archaeon]|nr:hypothetical protein [Candidatus Bathyarchaeota archaeon]